MNGFDEGVKRGDTVRRRIVTAVRDVATIIGFATFVAGIVIVELAANGERELERDAENFFSAIRRGPKGQAE